MLSKFTNQDRYPMNDVNHLTPERMTPEQRLREIGSLLAKGLNRLRLSEPSNRQIFTTESQIVLGFSGNQSVHADHVNNRGTRS